MGESITQNGSGNNIEQMSVEELKELEQHKWDFYDKYNDGTNVERPQLDDKRKSLMNDIRQIDSELLQRGVR